MKTVAHLTWIILASLLLSQPAFGANVNAVCSGAAPHSTNPMFPTIRDAVNSLATPGPHAITIYGTCVENVNITAIDRLMLVGAPGSSVVPQIPTSPAVTLSRMRAFIGNDLHVVGRVLFISVQGDLNRALIERSNGDGIQLQDMSTIRVSSSTIRDNNGSGVSVDYKSMFGILSLPAPTTIEGNGSAGISSAGAGEAVVNGSGHVIRRNVRYGILVSQHSTLRAGATSIEESFQGIVVTGRSYVHLTGTAIRKTGFVPATSGTLPLPCGICLFESDAGLFNVDVTDNAGDGIFLSAQSEMLGVSMSVTGNKGHGIHAEMRSGIGPLYGNVSGNTGDGIRLETDSYAAFINRLYADTSKTIGSNGGDAIACDNDMSWVSGDLNGVGKIHAKCKVVK